MFFFMLYIENTEQLDTGIENEPEWSNGMAHFDRTGPTKNSGPPRKANRVFFETFPIWPNRFVQS